MGGREDLAGRESSGAGLAADRLVPAGAASLLPGVGTAAVGAVGAVGAAEAVGVAAAAGAAAAGLTPGAAAVATLAAVAADGESLRAVGKGRKGSEGSSQSWGRGWNVYSG